MNSREGQSLQRPTRLNRASVSQAKSHTSTSSLLSRVSSTSALRENTITPLQLYTTSRNNTHRNHLSVNVHLSRAAAVPCCKQHTTTTAFMGHILERVHQIGDTTQAEAETKTHSPGMGRISCLICNVCQGSLTACWAVYWCGPTL